MKKVSLQFVLNIGLGLFLLSIVPVSAQPLTKDTPTGNLTGEVDISIDPVEPLPANGTVTISTEVAFARSSTFSKYLISSSNSDVSRGCLNFPTPLPSEPHCVTKEYCSCP